MGSSRLAFVIVAVAAVAAAGGGSYLATRHNAASVAVTPASAAQPAATEVSPPAAPAAASAVEPAAPAPEPAPKRVERVRPIAARPAPPATASAGSVASPTDSPAPVVAARVEAPSPAEETLAAAPAAAPAPVDEVPPAPAVDARASEPPQPDTPRRSFEELVVRADAVIGLQMDGMISSDRARVEDRVVARVSRDVRVGSTVAIPAGARALGNVVVVERGGRVKERATLGIRFHTLELADGSRLTISTDTIYRYGEAPGNGSAAKIGGGAVAGAILGAIINGGKGAAIGAATGAGAGTAAVMTGERSAAVFPAGSDVTARILSPVTVSVERE